jgi:hypothetical protein
MSRSQSSDRAAAPPGWETLSPAEQIAELMAELQHREQLVEALTQRLEETAEQLDRLRRAGAERGQLAGAFDAGAGLGTDVLRRQVQMADRVENVLNDWEEVDGAATLKRLDIRMEKLIDLIRESLYGTGSQESSERDTGYSSRESSSDHSGETSREGAAAAPSAPAATATVPVAEPVVEEPLELVEPPPPVAETEADPAALKVAVLLRDEYIAYLLRELRKRRPVTKIDWVALHQAPAEFVAQLKRLEQRLQIEIQKEELSLSLERARLSREQVELQKIRSRLDREIRRLGGGAEQPAVEQTASAGAEKSVWGLFRRKS